MVGILLITHNGLGDSLADCVRHVIGRVPDNLRALPVYADDDPQRKEEEARALVAQLDTGSGVLLLCDLFGSTPCNIARRLHQPGRVEGLAGVNMPMLLRAVHYSDQPLQEVARKALESGRDCMIPIHSDPICCDAETGCSNY